MNDFPSAGDYAQSSADRANRDVAKLKDDLTRLRDRVVTLENSVGGMEFADLTVESRLDFLEQGLERAVVAMEQITMVLDRLVRGEQAGTPS